MSRSYRLTDVIGMEATDEFGRRVGHVHDLIADRQADRLVVTDLIVRSGGLRTRLGLPLGGDHDRIPWSDVVRIGPAGITVRRGRPEP
jgi:sporulation protein YlmC with PRC-barrel domain